MFAGVPILPAETTAFGTLTLGAGLRLGLSFPASLRAPDLRGPSFHEGPFERVRAHTWMRAAWKETRGDAPLTATQRPRRQAKQGLAGVAPGPASNLNTSSRSRILRHGAELPRPVSGSLPLETGRDARQPLIDGVARCL